MVNVRKTSENIAAKKVHAPPVLLVCLVGLFTWILWSAWNSHHLDANDVAPRTALRKRMQARNLRPPRMVLDWERWLPYHIQTRMHRRPVCATFVCDPKDMQSVIGRALLAWYNTFHETLLVSHMTELQTSCPHTYDAWNALRTHAMFHDARFASRPTDEKMSPVAALICINADGATVHMWRPSRRVHQCHAQHKFCALDGAPHLLLALTRKGALLDFDRHCKVQPK